MAVLLKDATGLAAKIAEADKSTELLKQIGELDEFRRQGEELTRSAGTAVRADYDATKAYQPNGEAHPWTRQLGHHTGFAEGAKAFDAPSGAVPLVPLAGDSPLLLARAGNGLVTELGIMPWPVVGSKAFSYLRQTCGRRAPRSEDPSDGDKPASEYGFESATAEAQYVAHIAEPIREEWLSDYESLNGWITREMVAGIGTALEDVVVNANGTPPEAVGVLNDPLVLTQPFGTDAVTSIREALVLARGGRRRPGDDGRRHAARRLVGHRRAHRRREPLPRRRRPVQRTSRYALGALASSAPSGSRLARPSSAGSRKRPPVRAGAPVDRVGHDHHAGRSSVRAEHRRGALRGSLRAHGRDAGRAARRRHRGRQLGSTGSTR